VTPKSKTLQPPAKKTLPRARDRAGGSASAPSRRWPVAILGATGAVGQSFIRLLADHPWFEITDLAASERSAGRAYGDVVRWLEGSLPDRIAALPLLPCTPEAVRAPVVFSALDSAAAGEIEPAFARAGRFVLSNAQNFRMEPDVPLVIPEINADHLGVLGTQRRRRHWTGAIVTNANCAATGAAVALAPLHTAFGVEQVFVTTMQAVSGAGYPGVPSLDILGNVVPFIGEEEAKIERELPKLLGSWNGTAFELAPFAVSAQTNRVPVEHGHLTCLAVKLARRASPEDAIDALRSWSGGQHTRGLPSAPDHALVVTTADARPQPRRDANVGHGMTVTVGRVRSDPILDLRLVALAHNVIRGAAGGSILNAELLAVRGELPAS
jgi:aspartate-semialdehyde dehydrogenase